MASENLGIRNKLGENKFPKQRSSKLEHNEEWESSKKGDERERRKDQHTIHFLDLGSKITFYLEGVGKQLDGIKQPVR